MCWTIELYSIHTGLQTENYNYTCPNWFKCTSFWFHRYPKVHLSCWIEGLCYLLIFISNLILQINSNGIVSFAVSYNQYNPEPLLIDGKYFIAPYWSDVDTRGIGDIYFRTTTDDCLLSLAREIIQRGTCQVNEVSRFKPKWLLIATWYQVGYYKAHTNLVCNFLLIIILSYWLYGLLDI